MSEALGVSRTPVREALGRLASEGFLERIPHRGFRMPEESLATLLELYPILSSLELLAGRLALPRLTHSDLDLLREINSRMKERRDSGKVRALVDLNDRFHRVFSTRSGSQRLADLPGDLRSQVKPLEGWYYSDPGRIDDSIAHHEELIDAIDDDHDGVLQLLQENMALTFERFAEEHDQESDDRLMEAKSAD